MSHILQLCVNYLMNGGIMSDLIANVEYMSTMIDVRDEHNNSLMSKILEVKYFGLTKINFNIQLIKDNFDSIEVIHNQSKDVLQILSTNHNDSLDDIFDELCSHKMILIIIDMILSIMYSNGDLSEYIKLIEEELSNRGYDSFKIYDEFVV